MLCYCNLLFIKQIFKPIYFEKIFLGPLIPKESEILKTPILKTKDKAELANMITSALKIFLPSESIYLNTNINTEMGFLLGTSLSFMCQNI